MREYLLGTEDGLRKMCEEDGVWRIKPDVALKGKKILCGVKSNGRIVAACYSDGIYISKDSGLAWQKVDDNRFSKVRCLRRVTWNGQEVLFVGTEPVGLYISHDGGDSWSELGRMREFHEAKKCTSPQASVEPNVRDVVADGRNGNSLYVAIQLGGILIGQQKGERWEEKQGGLNLHVHRLLMEPSDRTTFYAATEEEGIFVTEDGGNKWHRCGADFPWTYTIPFEICKPRYLIAGMARGLPSTWARRESGAEAVLAVSKDGGASWTALFPGRPLSSMIMDLIFTSYERDSVICATGVTLGGLAKGTGQLYRVNLDSGQWELLTGALPGVNLILALQ